MLRFYDDVVGATDEKQMLDIVPAQQDQLPLPVEFVDIDDTEAGLSSAGAGFGQRHAPSRESPEDQHDRSQHSEDDGEDDQELERKRAVRIKER